MKVATKTYEELCIEQSELAEIGRLAVERERIWMIPIGDPNGVIIDGIEDRMRRAIDAFLSKQPKQ